MADTHYMLEDVSDVEFPSRRQQTARIAAAIRRVNALDPDFVVHLGDLVQEYPETEGYERAIDGALDQLEQLEPAVHYVAGNHDVGDKPDPTMPTDPVTSQSLEHHHERLGRSWFAWERSGCHFIALNSQLMNTGLPAADEQRDWAADRLGEVSDGPAFVFLHLPPYLDHPDEPALGHYDILAEPARSWLLGLVRATSDTYLFAGHCHFQFLDQLGDTWIRVAPSVAFTRPGFAELFSSGPPPERGRNEAAKLGFLHVRVIADEPVVRTVRTNGATDSPSTHTSERFLTRTTGELASSPVGVSLAHPLSGVATVPEVFPSATQYTVPNAYPTIGCLDTGIDVVRLPLRDLATDVTRRHLRLLRRRGATVIGTTLGGSGRRTAHDALVDEIEIRLPVHREGAEVSLEGLGDSRDSGPVGHNLSTVFPKPTVQDTQHGRLRNGFAVTDLDTLDARLADQDLSIDRVICRIRDGSDPWAEIVNGVAPADLTRITGIDWHVTATNRTMAEFTTRIALAVAAVATCPGARVFIGPLRAMDRTMDLAPGLLDRRCNPTPAAVATGCLMTALFREDGRWTAPDRLSRDGVDLVQLTRDETERWLAVPPAGADPITLDFQSVPFTDVGRVVSLSAGQSRSLEPGDPSDVSRQVTLDGPTLFCIDHR